MRLHVHTGGCGCLFWLEGQRRQWERKGKATPQPR